jgi:hypothetical protein
MGWLGFKGPSPRKRLGYSFHADGYSIRTPDGKSPILNHDSIVKLGFSVKEIWSDLEGLVSAILNSFSDPKDPWAGHDRANEISIHRDLSAVNGLDMRWRTSVNQLHRIDKVGGQLRKISCGGWNDSS